MNVRAIALSTIAGSAVLVLTLSACSSSKTTGAGAGSTSSQPGAAAAAVTLSNGLLAGPNGHTLYFNTVDTATAIKCTAACAAEWPPLSSATAGSGLDAAKFGTATRPDGSMQVTYFGHPLYYFAGDTAKGEKKGDGLKDQGGEWYATTPAKAADEKPGDDAGKTPGNSGGSSPTATMSSSSGYNY